MNVIQRWPRCRSRSNGRYFATVRGETWQPNGALTARAVDLDVESSADNLAELRDRLAEELKLEPPVGKRVSAVGTDAGRYARQNRAVRRLRPSSRPR